MEETLEEIDQNNFSTIVAMTASLKAISSVLRELDNLDNFSMADILRRVRAGLQHLRIRAKQETGADQADLMMQELLEEEQLAEKRRLTKARKNRQNRQNRQRRKKNREEAPKPNGQATDVWLVQLITCPLTKVQTNKTSTGLQNTCS